jgi:hypothetical protein
MLEDRAVGMNTLTRQGFRDLLPNVLTDQFDVLMRSLLDEMANIREDVRSLAGRLDGVDGGRTLLPDTVDEVPPVPPIPPAPPASAPDGAPALFYYENRFHRVPMDFTIPTGTAVHGFTLFCQGDAARGVPPLQLLTPDDLGLESYGPEFRKKRQRLNQMRVLFNPAKTALIDQGRWVEQPSDADVRDMFNAVKDMLSPEATTATGRNRQVERIKWTSVLRLKYPRRKRARADDAEYSSDSL